MIEIKTEKEIETIAEGSKILSKIVNKLQELVKPGITTDYLNRVAKDLVLEYKAKPSFENYLGFPAALCTSLNEVIVHGAPSSKTMLKEGDIISLDLGLLYKGFHSDMAVTLAVGRISKDKQKLISAAKKCLDLGIEKAVSGNKFKDISKVIQDYAESQGFSVVRELCGHGIGKSLHEDPQIINYVRKGEGEEIITKGMVFCIEPMITTGDWRIEKAEDGFGLKPKDNSLSAHFEHTIAITAKGPKVLTIL